MSQSSINTAHQYAIEEIIHRWFAFFEGTTVSAKQQCDLFTKDAQIIHAGQYLLANGLRDIENWLNSVPAEISSHTVEGLMIEPLATDSYQLRWQTAYQSLRGNNQVGGAIIAYQALVDMADTGAAKFRLVQKTPIASNPNLSFQESFSSHRLKGLHCRLARLIESFDMSHFNELKMVASAKSELLSRLQAADTHIEVANDQLLLHTPDQTYPLRIIEQPGVFPFLTA